MMIMTMTKATTTKIKQRNKEKNHKDYPKDGHEYNHKVIFFCYDNR